MAAELFTEYHTNLRATIGDFGRAGIFKYHLESLNGALISVVQMGVGPKGVAVNSARTGFDPAPATPDARGYLVAQAALLMIGGQLPVSIQTRALRTRVDSIERLTTVDHLRRLVKKIEKEGDPHGNGGSRCFGVWADAENALERASVEPERVV